MTYVDVEDWCASSELSDALIVAPPGCGKTELLARRAAVCVNEKFLPAGRRILALTFTNRARSNLASRVENHLGSGHRRYVTVINFHGLALLLYKRHGYVLDEPLREVLPDDRELRRIMNSVYDEYSVPRDRRQVIAQTIRDAKAGPFSDAEVRSRLRESGIAAALAYEERLQSESRMDYDDVLRMGLRVIQCEGVARLYAERFAYVLVDEAQDLTRVQYDIVEPIGYGRSVFAGDLAQGIYAFAGADPEWVFERIRDREPATVRLTTSYRSAPEVLSVVSSIAAELGGDELTSADPSAWDGRGRVGVARFASPNDEATWLVRQIGEWQRSSLDEDPSRDISIGVLTRMKPGGRRDMFVERMARESQPLEIWDHPLHKPEVVSLLRKHVDGVLAAVADSGDQVEELYLRCSAEVSPDNALTMIDLRDAIDELADSTPDVSLRDLVDDIRIGTDVNTPVGPGVHLLTGHAGKGQGFDKVVILGFEEGQIPSYFVRGLPDGDPRVLQELALLHVMASRAREELVFTICRRVNGYRQSPSRWLPLVADLAERIEVTPGA